MCNLLRSSTTVLFGLLPSLVFFWWLTHSCRLRAFEGWLPIFDSPTEFRPLWNLNLFVMFGLWHSGTAGINRVLYTVMAGITALLLIAFWQPMSGALWSFGSEELHWWFGTIQFIVWLFLHGWIVAQIGIATFLGIQSAPEHLVRSGPFAWCRHPMHLNILLTLLVTPAMTTDRLTLLFAVVLYLAVAIPVEESRLWDRFGLGWLDYKRKTPMLIPKVFG